MEYKAGDLLVVRLEVSGEQRFGKIMEVTSEGFAIAKLQGYSEITFYADGKSFLGMFTIIKKEENRWGTQQVEQLLTERGSISVKSKRDVERDGSWLREQAHRSSQLESEKL